MPIFIPDASESYKQAEVNGKRFREQGVQAHKVIQEASDALRANCRL